MGYTLGGIKKFSANFTSPVGTKNEGDIGGFRAFARRSDGTYHEVFKTFQENGMVDGENQGAGGTSTWDTKADALKAANAAHAFLKARA